MLRVWVFTFPGKRIRWKKLRLFIKNHKFVGMANSKNKDSRNIKTTFTNLPGLKGIKVIVSQPMIIKENSSKPIKK